MAASSSLDLLSPTRQLLLLGIKRHGKATAEVLARETFLSIRAVRQHLMALALQGLVSYEDLRDGPGRPKHLFALTAAGESLFPQFYSGLATTLLRAIEEEEPDVRERILRRIASIQLERNLARITGTTTTQRSQQVRAILEDYGYLPEVEVLGDEVRMAMLHCPIWEVARRHPAVCESERHCLEVALGGRLRRIAHKVAGDPRCEYVLVDGDAPAGFDVGERGSASSAGG